MRENQSFVRFEPPDLCVTVFVGDIDATEMRWMNEQLRRAVEGRGHVFLLIDQSRSGSVSAEARRLSVEGTKNLNIVEAAVFGASFHIRVIMSLIVRVLKLLRGQNRELIHFFSTEAEARAYLAERRRILFGDLRDFGNNP